MRETIRTFLMMFPENHVSEFPEHDVSECMGFRQHPIQGVLIIFGSADREIKRSKSAYITRGVAERSAKANLLKTE